MIEDSPIELVDSIKYICVQVDKYLVWNEKITSVQAKVSRSLGCLKYEKKVLPKEIICKLYKGILSHNFDTAALCGGTVVSPIQSILSLSITGLPNKIKKNSLTFP